MSQSSIDEVIATDKDEKSHKTALDSSEVDVVKSDFTYKESNNTFTALKAKL
ncbi:MAG: hypothetical protein NTX38_15215 [Methylobacter sp.]|nr:hypothetical protein [Methylobacter sp.]